MKNLLILFLFLFPSCVSEIQFNYSVIVTGISAETATDCTYYVRNRSRDNMYYDGKFIDSCGKFQIGDTVIVGKK